MTTSPASAAPAIDTRIAVTRFRVAEGCVAYLVADEITRDAMVIDPRLDQVDELVDAARDARVAIRWVLDTHTHADHLSGVALLAERTGARAFAPGVLQQGEAFRLGDLPVELVPTPGHTSDSHSVLVAGQLFTGDALFVGGAGRTDFPGGSTDELYESFRRYEALPDETVVHPGHDYTGHPVSTIGAEKRSNPLLAERDVAALHTRMDVTGPPPANLLAMLEFNREGAQADRIHPVELDSRLRLRGPVEVIDVRSRSEFASERIAGARHVPLDQLELRMREIDVAAPVVVVCQTGARTIDAMRTFRARGVAARALENGINGWKAAGLPVEGSRRLSVERQTQLTIGTMVLLGTALAAFVNPWFLVIPAFFGGGLAFAGASGTCGLALVLGRMPWNRTSGSPDGAACAVGGSSCAVGGAAPNACAVGGVSEPTEGE